MAIQQRLERLERRVNRSRKVLVRLVRCVFAVGLLEDTIDDGITRAKMLIVTNDDGTPVVMLGAGKDDGHGVLAVNSKTGKNLTHAAAGDNGFF